VSGKPLTPSTRPARHRCAGRIGLAERTHAVGVHERDHAGTDVVGSVHSWDLSTGVDGPGPRLAVFLKGCPLACQYCHNPDTWSMRGAKRMTSGELLARARRYAPLLRAGGGVTVSGGEPLLQPAFTAALLSGARTLGLHTALDTSGALGDRADDTLLSDVNLVLLDIKAGTPETYRRLTGGDLEATLRFARRLADRGTRMWVRHVLVPGWTTSAAELDALTGHIARIADAVDRVEVLAYHTLGAAKWDALGMRSALADVSPPTPDELAEAAAKLSRAGLPTVTVGG
jgi:pyruvate formate lyase activating enzyme